MICEMGAYMMDIICIGPAELSWVVWNVENQGPGRPVDIGG
jgi:hypothetical protein